MTLSIDSVRVAGCTAYGVAIGITLIRLVERFRQRKFGADDAWAAFAVVQGFIFIAALVIHLGDPTHLSKTTRVAQFYLLAICFYGVIWCCRLSILASVIRISPAGTRKQILQGVSGVFIFFWLLLFSQLFWTCEVDSNIAWKELPAPQCTLGRNVAITQLITDTLSDAVLIAAPLQLLWNVQISTAHRYRLMAVFGSTIVTTASSLVHAYYVLRVGGLEEVFAALIENSLSLIVCNLAVLIATVSRLAGCAADRGEGSYGRSQSQGSYPLAHVTIGSMPTRKAQPTATTVTVGLGDVETGDCDSHKMHASDVDVSGRDAPWAQSKGPSLWEGGRGVQVTQEQFVSR